MNLEKGKFYTIDKSDIVVFIRKIKRSDEHSTIADVLIFRKNNGSLLEQNTEYTLSHERIKHWKEYNDA